MPARRLSGQHPQAEGTRGEHLRLQPAAPHVPGRGRGQWPCWGSWGGWKRPAPGAAARPPAPGVGRRKRGTPPRRINMHPEAGDQPSSLCPRAQSLRQRRALRSGHHAPEDTASSTPGAPVHRQHQGQERPQPPRLCSRVLPLTPLRACPDPGHPFHPPELLGLTDGRREDPGPD